MNQSEHLDRILAKCRANLALAEKRTPGKWREGALTKHSDCEQIHWPVFWEDNGTAGHISKHADANFIATCAGSAEAGWRSTIAAIEDYKTERGYCEDEGDMDSVRAYDHKLSVICDLWPEELL